MGTSESTLRTGALLLVLDRREQLSKNELEYIKTDEFVNFYQKNRDAINIRACSIYGISLKENVIENNDIDDLVNEIDEYCSTIVIEIALAVDEMAKSGQTKYDAYFGQLVDFIDFTTLYNAIIGGKKNLYEEIKQYDGENIKDTYMHFTKGIYRTNKLSNSMINKQFKLAILRASVEVILDVKNSEKTYIFEDIIKHIKAKQFYSEREFNNMIQDIANNIKLGKLNDVYSDIPVTSRKSQKSVYNAYLSRVFDKYPAIGYFDKFF